MKKKITNYKRKEIFDHYEGFTNPFASITTRIDITNIYNLSKEKGHLYALIGYYLTKSMNSIEEFHYTYDEGEFYYSDYITPSYTELKSDKSIGFFDVPLIATYEEYIASYDLAKEKFFKGHSEPPIDGAYVWLSCEPWFKASSITPPFDKNQRIPQMIWDKYEIVGDKVFIDLMILFHHGFADGYHIGKLISAIEENISEIEI